MAQAVMGPSHNTTVELAALYVTFGGQARCPPLDLSFAKTQLHPNPGALSGLSRARVCCQQPDNVDDPGDHNPSFWRAHTAVWFSRTWRCGSSWLFTGAAPRSPPCAGPTGCSGLDFDGHGETGNRPWWSSDREGHRLASSRRSGGAFDLA